MEGDFKRIRITARMYRLHCNVRQLMLAPFFLIMLIDFPVCYSQVTGDTITLALRGAKIFPAPHKKPINDGTVLIKDGKIIAVGPGKDVAVPVDARVVDCAGLFMFAGFWNCHVHLMEPKWQQADQLADEQLRHQLEEMFTRYGFTHIFDLATLDLSNLLEIRSRIKSGRVKGPELLLTGVPFAPPAASPFYIAPLKLPELATKSEGVAHVTEQIEAGTDGIKLWSASPTGHAVIPMPMDVMQAATQTAHRHGKPAFAHPTNLLGARLAAMGGVDILAHVAADDRKDWDPETLDAMISANMALIPTLKLHQWDIERSGLAAKNHPLLEAALVQVGTYHKEGGEVLFGTDVGYMTDYSPADEYRLMASAGMGFSAILASMTTRPSNRFGYEQRTGQVAVGMDADLVLLSADPTISIMNFCEVQYTLRNGEVIYSR